MTTESGLLLLEAVPAIEAGIYRCGRPQGSETRAELAQDAVCVAAKMIESCEARGVPVIPKSVAYYAIQASKSGRRSQSTGICDAMAERTRAMGRSLLVSTTANIAPSDPDGLSFGDVICDRRPDPATEAAKRLDWAAVGAGLDARAKAVVRATAAGESGTAVAQRLGVSAAAVVHIKRRAADVVLAAWGCSGLEDALIPEPGWRRRLANA